MASRLEKIGTIFSRTKGLLKSGAMKPQDKPIWFDVYAIFPPHQEPRYDRPTQNIPLRPIFYEEDKIRAKFHRATNRNLGSYNLSDNRSQSQTQAFIQAYQKIKDQGALDEESIFEAAKEMIGDRFTLSPANQETEPAMGLVKRFTDAQKSPILQTVDATLDNSSKKVDLKNIFD